jgi:hypothetical protein
MHGVDMAETDGAQKTAGVDFMVEMCVTVIVGKLQFIV